jgi:hypothetical protein
MLGQGHAHGMDGVVTVKTFGHEAVHRSRNRDFITEGDLGFDDGVDSGVKRGVWQAYAGLPVVCSDDVNALTINQVRPLFRVRRHHRIVPLHRIPR